MDIEQARLYALSLPGATEDMPYGPDWVVFRIEGKIFMHICLTAIPQSVAVKLPPDEGEALRDEYDGIRSAYHLNKRHWNDILLEYGFSDEQVKNWIRESYQLVLASLPKKAQAKLMETWHCHLDRFNKLR